MNDPEHDIERDAGDVPDAGERDRPEEPEGDTYDHDDPVRDQPRDGDPDEGDDLPSAGDVFRSGS